MADVDLTPVEQRRQAALRGMERFADKHTVSNREWVERDLGDRIVFVGTADDGREFALGYMKETDPEADWISRS